MICKLQDPEIIERNPFQNCKLGREKYARVLTQIVSSYTNGCVLAINGEWGSGKTTFVKMWRQYLNKENFKTLYFNVWEHDFVSDPLVGLIGELQELELKENVKSKLATVIATGGKIFTSIVSAATTTAVKKYLGDEIGTALKAGIDTSSDLLKKELDAYKEQCNSIKEFRNALIDLIDSCNEGKPLIFMVDELDRCNPAYAVKVLERIKHLFSIPNIIFVLSIDKKQLCSSVRGYYGSDSINAEEYLKRFIDIEYALPEPDIDKFCAYLFDVYDFDAFFENPQRASNFRDREEGDSFMKMSKIIFAQMHLNLRQMEKIYAHIRLTLQTIQTNSYSQPGMILLLKYFRISYPDFYHSLLKKEITIQEIVQFLEEKLPAKLLSSSDLYNMNSRYVIFEIAKLLSCYSFDDRGYKTHDLLTKDAEPVLTFKLNVINKDLLLDAVKHYEERGAIIGGIFDLSIIIQRIELLFELQEPTQV